jgi:metallo-beta-lactamase family protein
MLQGGRILSHLKRYLPQANTVLLFVGFQPKNSLGRKILDGAKEITIDGDRVTIAAQIKQLMGYSSHKDQAMLLNWLRPQRFQLKKVFLVHGETEAKAVLSRKIMDNLGIETYLPNQGEEIIL